MVQSGAMFKSARSLSIILPLLLAACDPPPDDAPAEPRSFPAASYWSDVVCDVNGDGCWGRVLHAADLWTHVTSQCEIDARVASGQLRPTDRGWDYYTCAPNARPQMPPDVACYFVGATNHTICYAGENGWYAVARPACESAGFAFIKWALPTCDQDRKFGLHDFDIVLAASGDYARAFYTTESYDVRPGCYLDSGEFELVDVGPYVCPACWPGSLGCACATDSTCDGDAVCVVAQDGADVCAPPSESAGECAPGTVYYQSGCPESCEQYDDCGPAECSPIGPFAWQGICAWPA